MLAGYEVGVEEGFSNSCAKGFHVSQGKFIRIHFGTTGKLASADIETCKFLVSYICNVH